MIHTCSVDRRNRADLQTKPLSDIFAFFAKPCEDYSGVGQDDQQLALRQVRGRVQRESSFVESFGVCSFEQTLRRELTDRFSFAHCIIFIKNFKVLVMILRQQAGQLQNLVNIKKTSLCYTEIEEVACERLFLQSRPSAVVAQETP